MMMLNETETEAILIAFANDPAPRVADWMRRHPAQATEIARAAERRWCAEPIPNPDPSADAAILSLARQVMASARVPVAAPITSLVAAAEARGLDADELSERLDLPIACFWKLHRRLFAPESVPRTLIAALAESLARTTDEIAAYLQRPPTLAAGASYRSDSAPALAAREDFAAALGRDEDCTDTARARWLEDA